MESGRMPACVVIPFAEGITTGVPNVLTGHNNSSIKSGEQAPFGNKCGHNRLSPKFYSRPQHYKRRFHVIEQALRVIPIALDDPFSFEMFHGLMFHESRLNRSERREAELRLLVPAIFDSVNLVNMQLGYFDNNGKFINYTYDHFADVTQMGQSRVDRNMKHLQDYGLISVQKILKTLNDGAVRTERVIITVNAKMFEMLNLMPLLLVDRERSIKSHQKKTNKISQREKYQSLYTPRSVEQKRGTSSIQGLTGKLTNLHRNTAPKPYNPAQDKRVLSTVGELLKQDPTLTIAEAIKMVSERLKPPN